MNAYKALEIWTAQTLLDLGILFSIISAFLHIGRPYFERILSRMTLRVAADLWWLIYIILRDGLLFFSVLFIFLNVNLDLMADIKIGLPFVPFGMVVLVISLIIKVFRNTEDYNKLSKINNYIIAFGAFLNFIGYVLVMEAPGDEYPAAKQPFWQTTKSLRSNLNPELSTVVFYITFVLLILTFTAALYYFSRQFRSNTTDKIKGKENVQA
ncbi:hypothetical protein MROS_0786 [Melioribacter roseus P3M-2]|uniref:Uncharacterized protein n=1 Tax=Melioribacter roseus (strain DSM 23840 / JCM 17771 / VKM B-2668 / P3M-2) TaxID=1191523 RepID=I6ZYC8_MELRP|nr:hypothetical protein [Melioribacter roseus]AFN74028.1 hypothetical protein MROS_0786 [Melioribacter roseus P3M-2]